MKPGLLVVDDEQAALFGLTRYLTSAGYYVGGASCLAEGRDIIASRRFDAVILDLFLPDGNGLEWIDDLRASYPDIAIIVITGAGDIPLAVEAMRRGADNFLTKPVDMTELDVFLRKSLELSALRRKNSAESRLSKKNHRYFGMSPAMKEVMDLASLAAENESAVLLQGESGVGKGVLARWIYEKGTRKSGPFVEINCSSLRGELLASELFGHVRGAFTSAVQDRQGLIEVADGGTLFLDEIGDMDSAVQSQFLKVIEEKCYRRLGDVRLRSSDFRLICATNKDIGEEIDSGRFRRDLYFRINLFPIAIPPLERRKEDLPALAGHMLSVCGASDVEVSAPAMKLLMDYSWPGNVRELKNVIERALLLSRGTGRLKPEHFPGIGGARTAPVTASGTRLAQIEREYIKSVLDLVEGNVDKAARELGISRATLYRKLRKTKDLY